MTKLSKFEDLHSNTFSLILRWEDAAWILKSDITSSYLLCGKISELYHHLKVFLSYYIHYIPPLAVLSHWAHDVDAINQCCCLVQYLRVAYLSNSTLLYIRSRGLLPYLLWPFLYLVLHYYTAEAAAYYLTFYGHVYMPFYTIIQQK